MGRYVERDCSDCGMLVPANELIPYREKQLSGTTSRSGFRTGVRGGIGFSSGGSQRFRHVNLRLCEECASIRIAAARRARFWANMRRLVILGVIVAAVVAFINMKPPQATVDNANTATDANDVVVEGDNVPEPVAAFGDDSLMNTEASVQPQSVAADRTPSDDLIPRPSDTPSDDQDSPRELLPQDEVTTAIAAATPGALETGKPEQWKANGKTGYIVPSAIEAYGDRSCRNVYSTIIEHGAQTQSPVRQWCQPNKGGEWAPSP